MKKPLIVLYHFFKKRKPLFYTVTALLFGVMIALAARIHIVEDISHALPDGKQVEQINKIFQHSRFADKLVIRINATNPNVTPEDLISYAAATDSFLHANLSSYVSGVKSKVDDETAIDLFKSIHENLPFYLTDQDYNKIDTLISRESISAKLKNDYKVLSSASGLVMKKMIADDPIGISNIALKKLNNLQVNNDFDLYDGYIVTKDHKSVLLFVTPSNSPNETSKNAILVNGISDFFKSYEWHNKDLKAFCYGGTAVAVGNAIQLKQDTIITLSLTIVSLLLFLWFFFRRKRIPFIMMLPVVFGALFAIVSIGFLKGSISIIALAAGSIVLGIAINYSLHFFGHYKHCGSIEETIADLVMPLTIGSFTTVGSFLSLLFVKSSILNDFGLFAGLSLMGAAIFTLIFLPHFLPDESMNTHDEPSWLDKLITSEFKHHGILVLIIVALTIFFGYQVKNVVFMSDMMGLNYMNDDLKASEKQIMALQGDSSKTVYIASTGKNMDEALANSERLSDILQKNLTSGVIKKYSSLGDFILSHDKQQERINKWNKYWTKVKKAQVLKYLAEEGAAHKFKAQAFSRFEAMLNKEYEPVGIESFAAIRNAFGNELLIESPEIKAVISSIQINKLNRQKLYASIEKEPSTVILDKEVVTHKFIDIIYNDFNNILLYTSLLVFFALLLSYGRMELTIITFLPMFITWIWILGIMGLLGIQFNIINIIISTFIFGLGDDFAIFITDGLTSKFKSGKDTLSSHKLSMFLGAATTIIGLGALIFARHPALRSIAFVSIIGIICVLVIGQTVQPFIYNFYLERRKVKGFAPYTFFYLLVSIVEFSYFVVASLLMTLLGFIIVKLLPFPNIKTRKYWFHWLICYYMRSLVYIPLHVKKVHINKESMDFSKPAIIIANHSSILDILVTVMQHPKLILVTNDWVYNSPVYGKLVQLADYYPVADGTDEATNRLKDIIADGYSIVIFPEGTRSPDGRMKRFHKGAFFLAEKLNLDIVPLLLHGCGDVTAKGDYMVTKGQMTMKYLPRIKSDDKSFGEDYVTKAKAITKYFKAEHEKLRAEIEQPIYFKERINLNYIYKGPILEWYIKYKVKLENYYEHYHKLISPTANVLDIGCGYGQMSYMLHFLGRDRTITGVDHDEEKIDIANNCYSKKDNINFVCQSVTEYPITPHDVFIINDVLHYLTFEEQETLVTNCIKNLKPGGTLLIKDADKKDEKGQKLTWLTEFFSTNFGFNIMPHDRLYFTSGDDLKKIADKNNMDFSTVQDAQYSSNTIFAIRHR
jgi:1-acyl-sn-glycerol-3-phosphate acyltransferase